MAHADKGNAHMNCRNAEKIGPISLLSQIPGDNSLRDGRVHIVESGVQCGENSDEKLLGVPTDYLYMANA